MKMKQYIIGIALLFTSLNFTSCDSFFEAEPQDSVSENGFWKSETDAEKFLTNLYAKTFPVVYEGSIFFDEAMSDNAYLVWDGWYTDVKLLANGTQDSYGTAPKNIWQQHYANIRACWNMIENIEKIPGLSEASKSCVLGETRFLMAYNYLRLIIFFGDVPLVKKVMNIEESKAIARSPKADVADFIVEQLDEASAALLSQDMDKGRASWGACQTLKARLYLNMNNYPEVLKVTDGLMGKYALHTSGETPYEDLFSGMAENAPEIILSIVRDKSAGSIATGHYSNQIFFMKGMSGGDALIAITPSGTLIDSYPMADGRLIHEKGSTYNPKDPYKNRDPRLKQSVVYPTQQLKYLNAVTGTVEETLFDPEVSTTIPEQQYSAKEPSATGYMWNKYVDWSPYAMTQITDCTNDIILLRYADVLLMRAEAIAETQGIGGKGAVIDLIDQLRVRCKGGSVHPENYTTNEALINLVRNERRIELANEGLRYFDILRWKLAEKTPVVDGVGLKGDFYGAFMRLDGVGSKDRTVEIDGAPRRYVETRFFNPAKHYLQPIPQTEIELNTNLVQNPNW